MRSLLLLLPLLASLAGAPASAQRPPAPAADPTPRPSPYLDEALDLIRENALFRDSVEWTELRREARAAAGGARTPPEAYSAIRLALSRLGDGHSFLQLSDALRALERERTGSAPEIDSPAPGDRPPSPFGERMQPEGRLRPNTRVFGERTYGASTATRGFRLSDGANLVLAVSTFTDRWGRAYPAGLTPDESVPPPDGIPPEAAEPDRSLYRTVRLPCVTGETGPGTGESQ